MDFADITTSESVAIDDGIDSVVTTFGGIGNFITSNFLIAALFIIPVVAIGVRLFKRIMRRLGGKV